MKTIYTDEIGALPWVWLGLGIVWFALAASSFEELGQAAWWDPVIMRLLGGIFFLWLAIRRFLQIRRAKAEGRDHTIVRVKNAPDR